MKPSPLLLQSQRLLLDQSFRASGLSGADFADQLRKASPGVRSSGADDPSARGDQGVRKDDPTSAAESAAQDKPDPSVTDEQGDDQAQTGTPDAVTTSSTTPAAASAAKPKPTIVAGRARDIRERTEHEFLGKTDLAQLAAQELASSGRSLTDPTPAADQVTPQPEPAPDETTSSDQSAQVGAGVIGPPGAKNAPSTPDQSGSQSAEQNPGKPSPQPAPAAAARDGSGQSPDEGKPDARPDQSQGTPQPQAQASSPVSTAAAGLPGIASAAEAKAGSSAEPVPTKNDVAAVGGVRTTAQLLKKLERNPSALALAKAEPEKGQGPIPAAALRGLAAALRQGGGTVTLRLNPETLGSLKVQVSTQDAKVIARFEASTDQARQLLLEHVESLRSAMESRGLSVDKIVVERGQGWMPAPTETRHEQTPGGAGGHTPDQSSLWNSGQDASGQGQDGRSGNFTGQGSPEFQAASPGGAGGSEVQTAEDRQPVVSSIAFTEGSDRESKVMLRVDAVA